MFYRELCLLILVFYRQIRIKEGKRRKVSFKSTEEINIIEKHKNDCQKNLATHGEKGLLWRFGGGIYRE
ncbi:hypothetical protein VL10_14640 [Leclercia adecarboxylata]|nr:hypothetical protein VL10_14640 [Leclercia adecarboxylata]KMN63674.1 hypothetical protein VK95_18415 [Leclercia sp. LK8]